MGEYLPYAGVNSVQEAVIGVHFQSFSNWSRKDAEHVVGGLKQDLPEFQKAEILDLVEIPANMPHMNIGVQHGPRDAQSSLAGFQLVRVSPDGNPERAIRYMPNSLTVHSMKYSCWNQMLSDSLTCIQEFILPKLSPGLMLEENPVVAISLRYIDRYMYSGSAEEASADMLFCKNDEFLTTRCFQSGASWHCNSGWFEDEADGSKTLNQLEVSSRVVDQISFATIDHNEVCHLRNPWRTPQSLDAPSSEGQMSLKDILESLHRKNKGLLEDLLVKSMLEKINLVKEFRDDS